MPLERLKRPQPIDGHAGLEPAPRDCGRRSQSRRSRHDAPATGTDYLLQLALQLHLTLTRSAVAEAAAGVGRRGTVFSRIGRCREALKGDDAFGDDPDWPRMRRRGIVRVVMSKHRSLCLAVTATTLLIACGGDKGSTSSSPTASLPSSTATFVQASAPTPNPVNPFSRAVTVNQTQSVDGIDLTVSTIGIGAPAGFLPLANESTRSELSGATSVVVVYFSAKNPNSQDQAMHGLTGATVLVNDESIPADLPLSNVATSVPPGAATAMYAVFLSKRYAPPLINRIRFSIQKTLAAAPRGSFDFEVSVP